MKDKEPKKLKICMIMPKWHVGGAEVQVLDLVKNLDRSRFSLSMCLLNHGDRAMEEEAARHLDSVRYLGFRWRWLPVSFFRLVRYLASGRFDVVHAHLAYADVIGRLAAWTAGVPVRMTTEHGKNLWKSRPLLVLERMLNSITDARICVSSDIMEIRRRLEKTPQEKLIYIPNAVDPAVFRSPSKSRAQVMAEFGWPEDSPLVLSLGRVVEAKNYPLLIEAFARLSERIPSARCIIAGDGDRLPEVRDKAADLGLNDRVAMPGSRRDTADLLAAADVFALSSVREGLPVSLLEAMAARTPVVSTRVGGVPEAVADGESALLVPSGDAAALAAAMERMITDADLSRRLAGEAASVIERRFSIRQAASELGRVYEELAGRKGRADEGRSG